MELTNPITDQADSACAKSIEALRALINLCRPGPLMVHSDVFKAAQFVGPFLNKGKYLQDHCDVLTDVAADRPIWMPTFNYDFTKSGVYDVAKSASKVGALTEHFRRNLAKWRTPVPVFSYCGTGAEPELDGARALDKSETKIEARDKPTDTHREIIKPFGAQSVFANLVDRQGSLLFYGANFIAVTFLHYVEELCQALYRYDKQFDGTVVDSLGVQRDVTVEFHVRPLGETLKYNVDGMLADLIEARIARCLESPGSDSYDQSVIACDALQLQEFWISRLAADPFYMLHESCKSRFIAAHKALGRRVRLDDFESPPSKQSA